MPQPTAGPHPAAPPRPFTDITCQAVHPAGKKGIARFIGRPHGVHLQRLPYRAEPTGRVLSSYDEVDTDGGCLGIHCYSSDCKTASGHRSISEWRILPPQESTP